MTLTAKPALAGSPEIRWRIKMENKKSIKSIIEDLDDKIEDDVKRAWEEAITEIWTIPSLLENIIEG